MQGQAGKRAWSAWLETRWTWPALVLVAALVRLPALLAHVPLDDEAVYAVVARVMLHGGLPYLDAIERKPPLLFALYWAVFRAAGETNWFALHLVALGWVLLTMLGLWILARRLAGPAAGTLAALAYALIQPFATYKNFAFNGEVLMNLPIVWGYVLLLGRCESRALLARSAAAGVLMALAFLLKQPAAIAAVPLGLYLLGPLRRWRMNRWALAFVFYCLGFAATLGLCCAWLWREGILHAAVYWTVLDHTVPHVFWLHAGEHTALFAAFALPLVLPLFASRTLGEAWREHLAERDAVLGWTLVSAIGAAAGARFYPHYYIQILPPLAVLAAPVYARMLREPDAPHPRMPGLRTIAGWLGATVLATVAIASFQLRAVERPSPAARWVRAHSHAGDRLFVWGEAARDYVDAGRLPASRYIMTYPLTGYIFGGALPGVSTRDRVVPGAWDNLAADFAAHPPRYIIDTQAAPGAEYPVAAFPRLSRLLASDYRRVAALPDGVVYERNPQVEGGPAQPRPALPPDRATSSAS